MSYSYGIVAATKAEAKKKVAIEVAKIVAQQPSHAVDMSAMLAVANGMIDAMADDSTRDVSVSGYGSVSGNWVGSDVVDIRQGQCSVTAQLVERVTASGA